MLPISFRFVALSAATKGKAGVYALRMEPARTGTAPDWTGGGNAMQMQPVQLPLTDPSVWGGYQALVSLTFEKESGERLVMNDAVVALSRNKHIVSTPMTGMDGTVKEYINQDDYQLNIAVGVQAAEGGVPVDKYPAEGIRQLRGFFDVAEPLKVYSAFLELFDISRIVVTGFSATQATEGNYQPIAITALSDGEYNIYSTDY